MFEALSEKPLNEKELSREIEKQVYGFLGEYNTAKAGFMIVESKGNKGLIKVNNKYLDYVRSGLMMINKVSNNDTLINVINVSGMLNKSRVG